VFTLNILSWVFLFSGSIWHWAQKTIIPRPDLNLQSPGVPFLSLFSIFFSLPAFLFVIETSFGANLEFIWKFTFGFKSMVIKVCSTATLMISLLFGASCLFVSLASNTASPGGTTHYFFYPLVFGGVTYFQFTIISLVVVLLLLPIQTDKDLDRKENNLVVLLFYPLGLFFTLVATVWWGVFENSKLSINYLPGVTPLILLFPYFLTAIPFLYTIESFLKQDFYWAWRMLCGNKEVAIFGMLLSNIVLVTVITFFFLSPRSSNWHICF